MVHLNESTQGNMEDLEPYLAIRIEVLQVVSTTDQTSPVMVDTVMTHNTSAPFKKHLHQQELHISLSKGDSNKETGPTATKGSSTAMLCYAMLC